MKHLSLTVIIAALSCLCKAQIITTVAGTGTAGFSGDGGPATAAQVNQLRYINVDRWGRIYFSDDLSGRIRRIDTNGIISTVAGNGTMSAVVNGVAATSTSILSPLGVAFDRNNSLFLTAQPSCKIRVIDSNGIIQHFAGISDTPGFSGDGGAATAAKLSGPYAIAVGFNHSVYFGDHDNGRIRKVDTNGIITTVGGDGGTYIRGDGGPATAATISGVVGIACDIWGNLYLAEPYGHRIRKIDTSGIITTFAGTGSAGYNGDGGAASSAKMSSPSGVAIDLEGNIYVSDRDNYRIRRINTDGVITTVVGEGSRGFAGDGGPATAAWLNLPGSIAIDYLGNLFINDYLNRRIRKVTFNHASAFTTATSHYYLCPGSGDVPMDSLLGVTDIDTGQVLTWAVQSPAMHGTAVVSYSDTNTGGVQYPMGATYAGDTSLSRTHIDSFTVSIRDQLTTKIITKTIVIHLLSATAGSITGMDTLCIADTTTFRSSGYGGVWGTLGSSAIAINDTTGLATGLAVGIDSVYYTVNNTCATDTAWFKVRVKNTFCPTSITSVFANTRTFTIIPNPTNGTFNLQLPTTEPATITIKDLLGKTIHQTTTQQTTNTIYLDNTPAGIYLLTVRTAAGVVCGRLVVE